MAPPPPPPAALNGGSGGGLQNDENTPLIVNNSSNKNDGDNPSPATTASSGDGRLWDELDQPWPSTFERSIGLLASPILKPEAVNQFTKSPKPGSTPLALTKRNNLDRGFYTPDRARTLETFKRNRSTSMSDHDVNNFAPLAKIQSLDFAMDPDKIKKIHAEQQQKAAHIKQYRDQFVTAGAKKQQQQKDVESGAAAAVQASPGFAREQEYNKQRKHQKQQQEQQQKAGGGGGHGGPTVDATATFAQCVFNLSNILMGVGLLGLPFAFMSAGWYGGLFCLLAFGVMTHRTSILIGRELNGDPRPCHHFDDSTAYKNTPTDDPSTQRMLPPISSFPDIARVAFGQFGCVVLSVILYFELFSCIAIFLVAIGDHMHELFPKISVANHIFIAAAINVLPTVVLRTPALLSYLSAVGTVATIAVVLAVAAAAVTEGDISEQVAEKQSITDTAVPYHTNFRLSGMALAFGLVAYCFSGHAIVPSIYQSMQKRREFENMVTVSYVVVVGSCVLVGVAGYYMFGSTVMDQVTLSLQNNSKAATAMTALTWLMVLTAFSKVTLTIFPLALGFEEIFAPYLTSEGAVQAVSVGLKLFFLALAMVFAIYVPSFSFLCALVGMICTMTVSVVFPAAAHYAMFATRLNWFEKFLDVLFASVGLVVAVVGTIQAL